MKAKIKMHNTEDIVVSIELSMSLGGWRVLENRLKESIELNYHSTTANFKNLLNKVLRSVDQEIIVKAETKDEN